ncbi:MAG: hypothetical protein K2O97_14525 [Acetatifactor sp.]|nr:hypothetical protein [Acetatifactor sp.]MDE7046189.1 hypothetical protein [Acetatifactor sp.]
MGLFSKKPKELVYDAADCRRKKERMREMFNEAVEDGNSFAILHATETSTKFEQGFVFDTNTTSYYYYIVGYRKSDDKIVMVQIDRELSQHSEAVCIDMDSVVQVHYEPKYQQASLIYKKGHRDYGEIMNIGDTGSKTFAGITNTVQGEEREQFLDYLEDLRSRLQQQGHKQEKWKR